MVVVRFFILSGLALMCFLGNIEKVCAQNSSKSNAPGARKSVGQPQRQAVNFEDELVEGSSQKPELFYLFQKKNFNYKKLIRIRENFLPEMRRTSEDLHRRGTP